METSNTKVYWLSILVGWCLYIVCVTPPSPSFSSQMLLILQGIVDSNGKVDRLDFAKRIRHWMQSGFEELGDVGRFLPCVQNCEFQPTLP